ncbi:hypothetical protein CVT24_013224 [Panaeolus cyanescens]|uniref:F-box domain-containing protein n=1 Tax=Panaeolus cyanescens TaxID=181874 RepID=A0A409YMZ6_9AGAR|nr:hypothetical protein CVT24_013224 [Panaeolus cyanescens]
MENATFPIEIFCVIIDSVADSRPGLQNCSLVCKAFVPICRQQLFNCISFQLNVDVDRERITKLAHVLDANPSLGAYIHHIDATCYSWTDSRAAYGPGSLTPAALIALPSHIPHLRHLSLVIWRADMDYNECRGEVFGLCMLLKRFLELQSPAGNLQTMEILGIDNLPMHKILSVGTLTDLTIGNCIMQSNRLIARAVYPLAVVLNFAESRVPLNRTLKSLCFYSVDNLDPFICFMVPCLENLSIGRTTFAVEDISPLPPSASPCIQVPVDSEPCFNHMHSIRCWGKVEWTRLCRFAAAAGKKAFPVLKVLTFEDGYTGHPVLLENMFSGEILMRFVA